MLVLLRKPIKNYLPPLPENHSAQKGLAELGGPPPPAISESPFSKYVIFQTKHVAFNTWSVPLPLFFAQEFWQKKDADIFHIEYLGSLRPVRTWFIFIWSKLSKN